MNAFTLQLGTCHQMNLKQRILSKVLECRVHIFEYVQTSNCTYACSFTVSVGFEPIIDPDLLVASPGFGTSNTITFWWYAPKYLSSNIY